MPFGVASSRVANFKYAARQIMAKLALKSPRAASRCRDIGFSDASHEWLEAARQIAVLAPRTIMLMLTMHYCEQLVRDASVAGIRDVLSKSDAIPNHLLASLKRLQLNSATCPQQ
jgi:DNA-binding NarL/FixJ family response regulator